MSTKQRAPHREAHLVVLLVALLGSLVGAGAAWRALVAATASVEHADGVRLALERLVGTVADAETNERGFLLTEDASFHDQFKRAAHDLSFRIQVVASLTTDSPTQQARLAEVGRLASARLELLRALTSARRSGKSPADLAPTVRSGRAVMADLRRVVDDMRAEERALDAGRKRQLRVRSLLLLVLLVVGTLAMGGLCAGLWFRRRDAMARERAHADTARLLEQLERALGTVDALLQNSPIGMALFDGDLRLVRVNDTWAQMTGTEPRDLIGRRASELPPRAMDLIDEKQLARVLATGRPIIDEEKAVAKSAGIGGARDWEISVFLVPGGSGSSAGIGMLAQDVTCRKRAEQERAETLRFAEQFVSVLGHDLRNPLSAIWMLASAMKRRLEGSTETRRLERILAASERTSRMVNQLFDLSRSRLAGGIALKKQVGDLSAVVMGVVDEIQAAYPDRSIKCDLATGVVGEWDPDRLGQVVSNLVGNAIAHGDPKRSIRVRLSGGSNVLLEVQNWGEPIPESELPHLFEPYRRGYQQTEADGLGLGLYIADQIAGAHGGRISVRSSARDGTTFSLSLPPSSTRAVPFALDNRADLVAGLFHSG